jgi:hypothetical protein
LAKNNKSALLESVFVNEAIQDLLERSLSKRCSIIPYIVIPDRRLIEANNTIIELYERLLVLSVNLFRCQ